MPKIENPSIYSKAMSIIQAIYGADASFREGQYEAIEATMTRRRTLVVQRTGWGKSLVYFVCTKLLRERQNGVTMVVSPLLVLMQNQIEAAEKLGLSCDVLNSQVKDRRNNILWALARDALDLILVTPETLFSADVQNALKNIKIGLFVIDEAHCISDWGHDFRLEYGQLRNVIQQLPPHVPILATTATANDRVVADLKQQLGNDVYISRGSLARDSLSIQVLHIPNKAERYAWILQNITCLAGSGIIYCLTQRDCDYLADFLNHNGISAAAYYSRDGEDGNRLNQIIENQFQNNEIKVIVATIKLGMGYDKGDIAFVIHFQMPANIVSYYQQIGRAGRNIDHAYTFLMCGSEDEQILNYFIESAFPKEQETNAIMELIRSNDGLREGQLTQQLNIRRNRLMKALGFLQHDGFIMKEKACYYATAKPYVYDREHYAAVSAIRRKEMEQMKALTATTECYSQFITRSLDDPTAAPCGKCTNCLGYAPFSPQTDMHFKNLAAEYINGLTIQILPRKQWASTDLTARTRITLVNQPGLCLSKYGDAGYGELVKRNKYSREGLFCEELVGKSAELLRQTVKEHQITHACCVPSLRSNSVPDFALRLTDHLGLRFVNLLRKSPAPPQKQMENSSFQCANALHSFSVAEGCPMPERVLLIDDVVDSGWTMTVCGFRLMEAGCKEVYPFALADSSNKEV